VSRKVEVDDFDRIVIRLMIWAFCCAKGDVLVVHFLLSFMNEILFGGGIQHLWADCCKKENFEQESFPAWTHWYCSLVTEISYPDGANEDGGWWDILFWWLMESPRIYQVSSNIHQMVRDLTHQRNWWLEKYFFKEQTKIAESVKGLTTAYKILLWFLAVTQFFFFHTFT
jgi:hypothetical protein